jgi:molybdopterin-guanine dinucleotide biosynthesis protein B
MSPVDVLLVEGFKWEPHPKLEVHRPSVGKPLLHPDDPNIVAVASDTRLAGLSVPLFDLSDIAGIADFIVRRFRPLAA